MHKVTETHLTHIDTLVLNSECDSIGEKSIFEKFSARASLC